jgi:hypothetical protein
LRTNKKTSTMDEIKAREEEEEKKNNNNHKNVKEGTIF